MRRHTWGRPNSCLNADTSAAELADPSANAMCLTECPEFKKSSDTIKRARCLYALFFAVPLGLGLQVGCGLPPLSPGTRQAASAYALAGIAALHVAAALKHHFVDRDGLPLRMLPGRR